MFIFAFAKYKIILGLTGFDSKMRWYVSMRSDDIGENNYALAA